MNSWQIDKMSFCLFPRRRKQIYQANRMLNHKARLEATNHLNLFKHTTISKPQMVHGDNFASHTKIHYPTNLSIDDNKSNELVCFTFIMPSETGPDLSQSCVSWMRTETFQINSMLTSLQVKL